MENIHESAVMEGGEGLHLPIYLLWWFVILDVLDPDGSGYVAQINRIMMGPPFHFISLGLDFVTIVLSLLGNTDLSTDLPFHLVYLEENVRFL